MLLVAGVVLLTLPLAWQLRRVLSAVGSGFDSQGVSKPVNARRAIVVAAIGSTQTIAWASSYYMPAILGAPIAGALHLPTNVFFGLFSAALLLSAAIGPSVGRLIDRHGGRVLLAASNLVIAAGLVILATAHGIAGLVIAWAVLGVGIGMGLYDPAFAALTWLYGREARSCDHRDHPDRRLCQHDRLADERRCSCTNSVGAPPA